jgi:hypothetical protein
VAKRVIAVKISVPVAIGLLEFASNNILKV